MKNKIILKILSVLVITVAIFTCIALPCFATGWQDQSDETASMHPYAPDSITFMTQTAFGDVNLSIGQTYPRGTTNTLNGYTTTYYKGTQNLAISQRNGYDDPDIVTYTALSSTNIYPAGSINSFFLHWDEFTYTSSSYFDQYFTNELVVVGYHETTYLHGDIRCDYYDPFTKEYGTIENTWWITTPGRNMSLSYVWRDYLKHYLPENDCIVYNLDISVIPHLDPDTKVSTNEVRLSSININAREVKSTTPIETLVLDDTKFEHVYPEDVDASGLFNWLGDSISGVLNTPLFYLGEDMYVSLGLLVSVFVGISLLFAFMKLFSGG